MSDAFIDNRERQFILLNPDFWEQPMRKLLTRVSDCIVAVIEPNREAQIILLLLKRAMGLILLAIRCAYLGFTAGSKGTEFILFLSSLLGHHR